MIFCRRIELQSADFVFSERRIDGFAHICDIVTAAELRRAVIGNILRPGKLAAVCGDCEWSGLCQRLANDRPDFSG